METNELNTQQEVKPNILTEEQISYFACRFFNQIQKAEIISTIFNRHLHDIGKEWKRKEKADFAELSRILRRAEVIYTELVGTLLDSKDAVSLDDDEHPNFAKVHDSLREEATAGLRIDFAVAAALHNKSITFKDIEKKLYELAPQDNLPPQEVLELFDYK